MSKDEACFCPLTGNDCDPCYCSWSDMDMDCLIKQALKGLIKMNETLSDTAEDQPIGYNPPIDAVEGTDAGRVILGQLRPVQPYEKDQTMLSGTKYPPAIV